MAIAKITTCQQIGEELRVRGYGYTAIGPGGTNDAGVPWRQVVAALWRSNNFRQDISPPPGVTIPQIEAGEFHVWKWWATVPITDTPSQQIVSVEAQVSSQEAAMLSENMALLRYWGHTFDTDD